MGGEGEGGERVLAFKLRILGNTGPAWHPAEKTLILRQEGRIVQLSGLDVEEKELEFSVSKERQRG